MTAKELASRLDGRQYLEEMTQEEERLAEENGLVVVFGYSDDCIEFRGAIYDELGCYPGGAFFVYYDGSAKSIDEDSTDSRYVIPGIRRKIEAVWLKIGMSWYYKTDIPHETFNIYYGGELFCTGIVFDLKEAFGKCKNESDKVNVWHEASDNPKKLGECYLVLYFDNQYDIARYGEFVDQNFEKKIGFYKSFPERGWFDIGRMVKYWTELPEIPKGI